MLKKIVTTGALAALMAFSASSFAAAVTYKADADGDIAGTLTFDEVTHEMQKVSLAYTEKGSKKFARIEDVASSILSPTTPFIWHGLFWETNLFPESKLAGGADVLLSVDFTSNKDDTGLFEIVAEVFPHAGGSYTIRSFTDATKVSPVPVPAAAFMFAPALLGFAALRRKKRA